VAIAGGDEQIALFARCGPDWRGTLGGEVIERKQRFAILRQAFDRFAMLEGVFLDEDVDRCFGASPLPRRPRAGPFFMFACTERATLRGKWLTRLRCRELL
jgi:hypothetical protein